MIKHPWLEVYKEEKNRVAEFRKPSDSPLKSEMISNPRRFDREAAGIRSHTRDKNDLIYSVFSIQIRNSQFPIRN
jgi:hypothetical protein